MRDTKGRGESGTRKGRGTRKGERHNERAGERGQTCMIVPFFGQCTRLFNQNLWMRGRGK